MIGEAVPVDAEPFLDLLTPTLYEEFQKLVQDILVFEAEDGDDESDLEAREELIINKVLVLYAASNKAHGWDEINLIHLQAFFHAYRQAYCWGLEVIFEKSVREQFKAGV